MIRHLIPRVSAGRWSGGALTDDGTPTGDEVRGGIFAIQWLCLMVEIGAGRIR